MAVLAAAAALSCAGGAERALLDQFFAASRLRDKTALQHVATVAFEPHQQGIVAEFRVMAVSSERSRAAAISERDLVEASLEDPRDSQDARHPVRLAEKDVTVSATVRLPDRTTVDTTLIVTMQRALPEDAAARVGRWIVTAVRESTGPPSDRTP